MTKTFIFGQALLDIINAILNRETSGYAADGRLNLGGEEGEDGGTGGPPRNPVGQIIQTLVAYDLTQAETPENYGVTRSGWENSLLDNLNHIRYWQKPARWFEPAFDGSYNVYINSGVWWHGESSPLLYDGGQITVTAPDETNPRIDVVYLQEDGDLNISPGVAVAVPDASYPAGTHLPIAEIYIHPSGTTGITVSGLGYKYQKDNAQGYLYNDVRPFLAGLGTEGTVVEYLADLLDVSSNPPTNSQVLAYNSGIGFWEPQDLQGIGVGGGHPTLQVDGPLVTLSGVGGAYICTNSGTIPAVYMYCENPGASGQTIIDVNVNQVSIFDNPANRPSLSWDDANKVAKVTCSGEFTDEDVITIDIDQIADGVTNLTAVITLDTGDDSHPHSGGPHTGVLDLSELEDSTETGLPLLAGGPSGPPNYDRVGTTGIAVGAVTNNRLANNSVSNTKIQDNAVDDSKAGDRIIQLKKRQGSGSTNWLPGGSTNYTPGAVVEQVGAKDVAVGLDHETNFSVTFPEAFAGTPLVFVTTYCTNTDASDGYQISSITNTGFSGKAIISNDYSATVKIMWRAIGEEA